jgi:hypothetical protein
MALRFFNKFNKEEALKPKEIVDHSFRLDKKNARYVAPAKFEYTKKGYKVTTITKIPRQKARTHKVLINPDPDFSGPFKKANVKIDCDCGRHLFVWNYALLQYDAAIRDRTNHQPPIITNPAEIPGCCVDGDALVARENDVIPLRDIKVGDFVQTFKGLQQVVQHTNMGIKDTIKLFTKFGKELVCTPDHRILTLQDQNNIWKPASKICFDNVLCLEGGLSHLDKIIDIQPHKSTEVFDIGVGLEEDPHFFANGICVHNCKHGIIALQLLLQKNPSWSAEKAAKEMSSSDNNKEIVLTTLDKLLKRLRRGKE